MDTNEAIAKLLNHKPVHPFPEHMQLGRACAADGMVLLKNDNNVLPIIEGKVALFGAGASDTVTCGTGSGYAPAPYTVNVRQGLENAGLTLTSTKWLDRFEAATQKANDEDTSLTPIKRLWTGLRILIDDLSISQEEIKEAGAAETAIYVLRRNAGEGEDRKAEAGDYYLSEIEKTNLEQLSKNFKHVVVVLNTCVIDANFINEIPGIDGLLLMGLAGNESGNAVADVITGKVCPSGRLTDSWAKAYEDYPASSTFGDNDGDALQEDYTEDVYVGYRYFDSFRVEPLFPFGFGLSYTGFTQTMVDYSVDWYEITIDVEVENTGLVSGKEVVQIYASAPVGRINKPTQALIGFAKTSLIEPGAKENIRITVPVENLTTYDESRAAFIIEAGTYYIKNGACSTLTKPVFGINIDSEVNYRQVDNKMAMDRPIEIIQTPEINAEPIDLPLVELKAGQWETIDGRNKIERKVTSYIPEGVDTYQKAIGDNYKLPFSLEEEIVRIKADYEANFLDVVEGRVTMEAFVAGLDQEVLCRIVAGDANETPYEIGSRMTKLAKPVEAIKSSGGTTSLFVESLGIPNCPMTDGPAGLHVLGSATTSYPVGMVLAQTWDEKYCEEIGRTMGVEMAHHQYGVFLGPGMNIHRDPLCGRNFEYFSEDPLITGKIATAITKGIQSVPGIYVSIKHFACNNQEALRTTTNSTVSERALREIYLKGFEICVREAQPATVMTAYNKINGVYASSHYELLTEILRGEWGFDGLVMTDWGTVSEKAMDLHAGNDLIMGGFRSQYLMAALRGSAPEFLPNGAVKEDVFEVYGGFMKETIAHWNAFSPEVNGCDEVAAVIEEDQEIPDTVRDMVDQGMARIEKEDGQQKVIYKGVNRGAYLRLGDLQKCAINVLRSLAASASYKIMISTMEDK